MYRLGNLETLKTIPTKKNIDIRELLLRFHNEYYSADIMSVAVLSRGNLCNETLLLKGSIQKVHKYLPFLTLQPFFSQGGDPPYLCI